MKIARESEQECTAKLFQCIQVEATLTTRSDRSRKETRETVSLWRVSCELPRRRPAATRPRGSPGLHPPGRAAILSPARHSAICKSAAQWGLMTHGLHHAKTMACDCPARSAAYTKRASLGPDLLALLPLQRLAAATLRERPVPLRRDEVALHALHILRRLHRLSIHPGYAQRSGPGQHLDCAQEEPSPPRQSAAGSAERAHSQRCGTRSCGTSCTASTVSSTSCGTGTSTICSRRFVQPSSTTAAIYGCIRKLKTVFQPKVLRKVSGRHGFIVKTTTSVRLRSPSLSFLINDNILGKCFSKWFDI